ncbi:MAG: 30S ribosomal protein S13 [Candidatus Gracilibacteria bacterium]|jgi:small subunit ribosomal protein S13|nr:30S ribosomal protein S13 [Candidatus Gracilibacteria bacterium]
MARIAGVNLPAQKRIEVALTYVYGIGRKLSKTILDELEMNKDVKVKDLSEGELDKLREKIDKIPTEGDLKRKIQMDIKRLQEVGCYRGFRHARRLPARGQSTKYNCRTLKGKKKTVANKKIATK